MKKKLLLSILGLSPTLFLPAALVSQANIEKEHLKDLKFDPREENNPHHWYITSVKNQYEDGICWAFSTIAVAEANILKNKLYLSRDTLDLSELNIAYNTLNRSEYQDKLHNTDFDTYKYYNWKSTGSTSTFAGVSLMQWNKLKKESNDWQENNNLENYVLKDLIIIDHKKENVKEQVKKAILDKGAVSLSFDTIPSQMADTYYNPSLYTTSADKGHVATIVGWDDTIEASKFGSGTKQNGGWIVKNSWGTNWGLNGYFYVSYDANMRDLFTLDFISRSTYTNNYYYDGSYQDVLGHNFTKAAVSFQAKGAKYNTKEKLKAVNVGIEGDNVEIEVKIYRGNNDANPRNLTLGQLITTKNQKFDHGGLRTIELGQDIDLRQGEWFIIVAEIKNPSNGAKLRFGDELNSQNDFSYIEDNGKWINSQKAHNGAVARIKAFTEEWYITNSQQSEKDLQYAEIKLKDYKYKAGEKINNSLVEVYYENNFRKEKLILNKDYKLSAEEVYDGDKGFYHIESNVGYTKIIIEGIGDYKGKNSIFLTIKRGDLHKYNPENIIYVNNDIKNASQIQLNPGWTAENKTLNSGETQVTLTYSGIEEKYFTNNIPITVKVIKSQEKENKQDIIEVSKKTISPEVEYSTSFSGSYNNNSWSWPNYYNKPLKTQKTIKQQQTKNYKPIPSNNNNYSEIKNAAIWTSITGFITILSGIIAKFFI
ncbi:C1 family peptidase [Mycoplasma phocimorsus]|uniref:C1 family peptidase n=1 Tax=Mycoplasma phocimorsus TaxID=3045839 RepID=UPI0024BFA309|nr:C1 family peptidase [Mycoplasma phocimorsus]MDJ1646567.1 C1 family peptidase [Mycoplasma phocimorsus]MDJ1647635.1 C1 family peptidase [Mycoplasma phocimorsus]